MHAGNTITGRTRMRSRMSASSSMLESSFRFLEKAANRGPRPVALISPMSRALSRPVRGSMVTTMCSSAQRCTFKAIWPSDHVAAMIQSWRKKRIQDNTLPISETVTAFGTEKTGPRWSRMYSTLKIARVCFSMTCLSSRSKSRSLASCNRTHTDGFS